VQELARDAQRLQEGTAPGEWDHHVVVHGDLRVSIGRLRPLLHRGDCRELLWSDDELHAPLLEVLRGSRVVDVIVRGQSVPDFLQRDVHPGEVGEERLHHPGPPQVHEKT
jgi:hypothetical protein